MIKKDRIPRKESDLFLFKSRKAVYTNGGTLFVQGGDLSAALLLPASATVSGQVNRCTGREVCKPQRESVSFHQMWVTNSYITHSAG